MTKKGQKNPESGYALLLVFAMAAMVAIGLYMQVPRAAFEAQRDKEELLMDRGQEYSRAIALFVRKFNRFPTSMDELENTNNQRFLRRRYVDPMTGKADWRILHAGPGGVITDSITVIKKPAAETSDQSFVAEMQMFGAAQTGTSDGINLAARRRASDQPGAAGDPNTAGSGSQTDPNLNGGNSGTPGNSSNSGVPGYNGPVMVLPNGTIVPANSSGAAATGALPGGAPGVTGGGQMPGFPGSPGFPGNIAGGMPNGAPLPTGVAVQQNGQNTPPLPPGVGGVSNGAANLINQILTSPRPGGMNGLQGTQGMPGQGTASSTIGGSSPMGSTSAAPQQQVIGAGLAGVASKREQEGIKTYNDHTKYNEWEFVYDVTKDPSKVGQQQGAGTTAATGGQGRPAPSGIGATSAGPGSPAMGPGPTPPGQ